ncbi:uncharacterized protein N7484_007870 [Penicillium longicatenatum]|uniref:uncharacterized protein n=1 Tax=Penicillium longicatenatum TaxID=1561947 RepID=UPI002547C8DD|nr:uncharacterized protein N7484_007870 [Penicillium longicatenatum]KAJ5640008.1 hypothetical protein N7484_007870 [Penicillium longicatenatum]
MGRAEAGTAKAIGNKIKAKGLGRLRWYCQACERQMRDANGFKCHITSESHVRQMLILGENAPKAISDFSQQFIDNFVNSLRTQHGEKRFQSLTQFAQYLGKNGICRVEETEKGIFVSWIDNSPETMRKREAIQKKEREEKNDEQREQKMIMEQVERARNAAKDIKPAEEEDIDAKLLHREDGEKMTLNLGLGPKKTDPKSDLPKSESPDAKDASGSDSPAEKAAPAPTKISMSFGAQKPKNVFASAGKKNPLAGKKGPMLVQPKKMTEQERIMKAEMEAMERKRSRPDTGFANQKRPKLA